MSWVMWWVWRREAGGGFGCCGLGGGEAGGAAEFGVVAGGQRGGERCGDRRGDRHRDWHLVGLVVLAWWPVSGFGGRRLVGLVILSFDSHCGCDWCLDWLVGLLWVC